MRIAAIIAGQTRHFWYSLPSVFKHVIQPNNIDCYVVVAENSNWDYREGKCAGTFKMPESKIFEDCLGRHLIDFRFDTDYPAFNEQRADYINQIDERVSKINTEEYGEVNFWFYKEGKHLISNWLADEWLKVKKCSELIKDEYDIILRVRPDIPWYNDFILERTDGIRINHFYEGNKTSWAKEYLFYGNHKHMRFLCENFVDYIATNTESWRRGDEELCLVNEVQFGKMLHDYHIKIEHIKEHQAGAWYNIYNITSPYLHLSNFNTEPLVCYLDAGIVTDELNDKNIYL